MKDTNIERSILKTLRAGIDSIDELKQELRNQEQQSKDKTYTVPSINSERKKGGSRCN